MKKVTFLLIGLIMVAQLNSQTYSTGIINLSNTFNLEYSSQIDITPTEVTLTLVGPDDKWLGLGFGVTGMTTGGDVVIFDGTNLTDRTFQGSGITPTLDSSQDWSITSNTVSNEQRTIIATRSLNTGEANDFVFSTSLNSINLVWARGNSFSIEYHNDRGATASNITLGIEDFLITGDINIFPNPSRDNINLELPQVLNTIDVSVIDYLGKLVLKTSVSQINNSINISSLNNGIYLIKMSGNNYNQTKRIIKQ